MAELNPTQISNFKTNRNTKSLSGKGLSFRRREEESLFSFSEKIDESTKFSFGI